MSERDEVAWTEVDTRIVGEYSAFRIRRRTARSPRTGGVRAFDVVDRPDCVQIVAPVADGRLILVEQWRHGVQRVSLEFPAGVLEPGEDPVEGARRELQEETGYCAAGGEVIGVADMDPAIDTSRVHIVRLHECAPTGERREDEGEAIRVCLVAESGIEALIRSGALAHTAAIAAWHLHRMGR